MVIIEGMDNSGKTTLVNYLATEILCGVIRSPGPHTGEFLATWILLQNERLKVQPILFDRHPLISEKIYGVVLRSRNALAIYGDLMQYFRSLNPLIIYCRPPISNILDFGDRDQMEGVKETATILLDKYDYTMNLMRDEGFSIVTYDYTSQSLTRLEVLGMVREYFKRSFG